MPRLLQKILSAALGVALIAFGILAKRSKVTKWVTIPVLILSIIGGGFFFYRASFDTPFAFAYGAVVASYVAVPLDNQSFGQSANRDAAAQPFTVASTVDVDTVEVRMGNAATDPSTLRFYIYDDSSGNPGSVIATFNTPTGFPLPAAPTYATTTATLASPVTLNSGTTYWLLADNGANYDTTNFYQWALNTASVPYTAGELHLNGSWAVETGANYRFVLYAVAAAAPVVTQDVIIFE